MIKLDADLANYKYYVVYPGWKPGIYREYSRAAAASSGHPGDVGNRRGFNSWDEAILHYRISAGELPDPRLAEFLETKVEELAPDQVRYREAILGSTPGISTPNSGSQHSKPVQDDVEKFNSQLIGRWGELYAISVLFRRFDSQFNDVTDGKCEETPEGYIFRDGVNPVFELIWNNKIRESNQSPDIWVRAKGEQTYWEVKTTISDDKESFELTSAETAFAISKGSQYYIIRVIRAGTVRAEAFIYPNPFLLQDQQKDIDALVQPVQSKSLAPEIVSQISVSQEKLNFTSNVQIPYYEGIGRRKCSSARVRYYPYGTGKIIVNGKKHDEYFCRPGDTEIGFALLSLVNLSDHCDITVKVQGGGQTGQAESVRLGLARALVLHDPTLKPQFRKLGWLTRDPRVKERKKPGLKRARKAPTYTKR